MTFELDYTNPNLDEAGEDIPLAVIIGWKEAWWETEESMEELEAIIIGYNVEEEKDGH